MASRQITEAAAQRCELVPAKGTRDWLVDNDRPSVVIPQLQTNYHRPDATDVRVRPIATDEYLGLLWGAIHFTRRRKAQFCLFPEYSWPVSEAANIFNALDSEEDEGRAYFISFEHMTIPRYRKLLADCVEAKRMHASILEEEAEELSELNTAQDEEHGIVNVCFVVMRSANRLIIVPQRKLRPAGLEEFRNQWGFVSGRRVRLIESGDGCRFAALICFDLINRREETPDRPRDVVARERLNYLFVPECNPQPLHDFYFKGAIAMFQSPRWAQHHPIIMMANVATGSDLPPLRLDDPPFGFSRLIGRLGTVERGSEGHYVYSGFVTHKSPRTLREISAVPFVEDQRVSTVVVRPEQSIIWVRLPTMTTGPTRDASVDRFDTRVKIYRPVGKDCAEWRVVMPIPDLPATRPDMDIPEDLIVRAPDGLVGVQRFEKDLRELIAERAAPIRVVGPGGSGKSALVATVLADISRSDDDRVIWIDMPSVEPGSLEPLVEAILRKLGHGDAVAQPMDEKWSAMRHELTKRPTVIVLDSADHAAEDLLRRLTALHSWKTLVIVVSQTDGNQKPEAEIVVEKLNREPFRELVVRTSQRKEEYLPDLFVETTYTATGGTALGAVWAGQLLKAAPSRAPTLANRLSKTSNEEGLQIIYQWCFAQLTPLQRQVLGILCELPAPVPIDDLHTIIGDTTPAQIGKAVGGLHALGLLIHTRSHSNPPARHDRLHFRHPFVRQFWRKGRDTQDSWKLAVEWAKSVSRQYGKEGRKVRYSELDARWSNVSFVVRRLAAIDDPDAKRAFLEIWENVDNFLWITARWRERIKLGDAALDFAGDLYRESGNAAYLKQQTFALYDSLGKTHWHRDEATMEAERLLKKGYEVAAATGDDDARARYHWYTSRLHLSRDQAEAAQEEVEIAEGLASTSADRELQATIQNALGNVLRERGMERESLERYERAMSLIENQHSEPAEELRDIIVRNRGRLELNRGDYTAAIKHLEEAMERFGRAQNIAQQAECAVYHARALAGIDEFSEAERELDWAESVAATIGSAVVRRQITTARAEIEELRQRA